MNIWLRRLLLILTVGGGFIGVAVTIQYFPQTDKVVVYIMLFAFVGLYAYGIFAGLKLSESSRCLKHVRLYFGLQILFISSPLIAYRFCSGLQATIAMIQPGLRWDFRLGSEWQFSILSSAPWGCGVNFVALIILFLLYSRLATGVEEQQENNSEEQETKKEQKGSDLSIDTSSDADFVTL
jgi:hypothetical protein